MNFDQDPWLPGNHIAPKTVAMLHVCQLTLPMDIFLAIVIVIATDIVIDRLPFPLLSDFHFHG